ncbi:alpha/beta hydrolase family protein [Methanobacterium sp. ACI-7]|uniref:alpha/beta hydrolase family protein n=1 Tax=unclassified Methanobacterium TaxID=2627676 RepID=UPI0039C0B784
MRALGLHHYGGASIGECIATAERIDDGNTVSWANEWKITAEMVEKEVDNFMKKDEKISARDSYLRASMYYRSAEYYGFFSEPHSRENWEKSRECFQNAAGLFDISCEVIEIPFENIKLPGYFLSQNKGKKRPTVLVMGGFDSTAEELYFYLGAGAVKRGYNVLLFEGPGQVGTRHKYPEKPLRPDYELPVKSVVDYVLSRNDVDEESIALVGFSLGGYFVSRAAVYEKRIKACC